MGIVARTGPRGAGGAGTVTTFPLLLAVLAAPRTRTVSLVTVLGPPLREHLARRPALDPVRWTALRLVDDLSYASGVSRGDWTARLRPRRSRPR